MMRAAPDALARPAADGVPLRPDDIGRSRLASGDPRRPVEHRHVVGGTADPVHQAHMRGPQSARNQHLLWASTATRDGLAGLDAPWTAPLDAAAAPPDTYRP
ncbi:hypothetical protein ACIREE_37955 [Streptomyces sp. NPDC102467]|uniref:hypothetical protein n=1 Tax=Streptomyces sp. NPDC102467 TaxID=3366179 RepID=UPI0037FB53F7